MVTLITVIASVAILDLSWLAFFPIALAALLTVAYAGDAPLPGSRARDAADPLRHQLEPRRAGPDRSPGGAAAVKLLGSLPLINVITGLVVAALTSDGGGTDALGINVLIALFVSFTISFELTVLLSRSILRPIEDLEAATERIRQGRFDEHVPVTTSDEFGELSSAFNQMVDGLAERERLREAFGTYLDEEVAQHLISEDFEPHGEEVEVSLVFCDVRDFTTAAAESYGVRGGARASTSSSSASSRSSPATAATSTSSSATGCSPSSARPSGSPSTPTARCSAPSRSRGPSTAAGRAASRSGVGVNPGTVVAGSIGGAGRLSFSVIGDAVNLASRVEAARARPGDPVLITGATRALLSETIEVESRGEREIRGYDRRVELFAPLVPLALHTGPGTDVNDPLGDPVVGGLGRAPVPGDGLGRRSRPGPGVGRAGSTQERGLGRTHTLPGT